MGAVFSYLSGKGIDCEFGSRTVKFFPLNPLFLMPCKSLVGNIARAFVAMQPPQGVQGQGIKTFSAGQEGSDKYENHYSRDIEPLDLSTLKHIQTERELATQTFIDLVFSEENYRKICHIILACMNEEILTTDITDEVLDQFIGALTIPTFIQGINNVITANEKGLGKLADPIRKAFTDLNAKGSVEGRPLPTMDPEEEANDQSPKTSTSSSPTSESGSPSNPESPSSSPPDSRPSGSSPSTSSPSTTSTGPGDETPPVSGYEGLSSRLQPTESPSPEK